MSPLLSESADLTRYKTSFQLYMLCAKTLLSLIEDLISINTVLNSLF